VLLGLGCAAIGAGWLGRILLMGDLSEEGTGVVDDSPEIRAIRMAGERIRRLHQRKRPPEPGDWLDRHAEAGQTFDEFRAGFPNRAHGVRTTLYVVRLGSFTPAQERLFSGAGDLLGRFYNVPVKTLEPIALELIPARARRVHPTQGEAQILAPHVLELLKKRRPDDAVAVIALTAEDLWPGEGWNFVFGQASPSERVGVWSLHRQGDPETEYTTCLLRTLKTATHEAGHMFGIMHCTPYECCMNGSNHRAEADSRPLAFCPEDEMKVWWACREDPAKRYARLIEFADAHGLVAQARFWRASLAAIR
jgi:archaemetzincin